VTSIGGPFMTPEDVGALVRQLVPTGSPPVLPTLAELLAGSPPVSPPPSLLLHPLDAPEAFLMAWREWVAFVRPTLANAAAGCANSGEPCLQLARLDFGIEEIPTGLQVDGPVQVNDVDRPWLLHTRLVQELAITPWLNPAP
jgi:hypothetical protein